MRMGSPAYPTLTTLHVIRHIVWHRLNKAHNQTYSHSLAHSKKTLRLATR
jgi:hypothetical protein